LFRCAISQTGLAQTLVKIENSDVCWNRKASSGNVGSVVHSTSRV